MNNLVRLTVNGQDIGIDANVWISKLDLDEWVEAVILAHTMRKDRLVEALNL